MLKRPGIPLFLQFKLSHCMVRHSAKEVKAGVFVPPFYRMHLLPARHSRQHEMLLDLEGKGNDVYYSAPTFHTPEEFNEAYLSHQVKTRSKWIKPSDIGPLPDDNDHHVSFVLDSQLQICSTPRALETNGNFERFRDSVVHSFRERSSIATRRDKLEQTARDLSEISEKHRGVSIDSRITYRAALEGRHPLTQIAFYAQVFLDAQLFIVSEQGDVIEPHSKTDANST